jgi:hypothetical protein
MFSSLCIGPARDLQHVILWAMMAKFLLLSSFYWSIVHDFSCRALMELHVLCAVVCLARCFMYGMKGDCLCILFVSFNLWICASDFSFAQSLFFVQSFNDACILCWCDESNLKSSRVAPFVCCTCCTIPQISGLDSAHTRTGSWSLRNNGKPRDAGLCTRASSFIASMIFCLHFTQCSFCAIYNFLICSPRCVQHALSCENSPVFAWTYWSLGECRVRIEYSIIHSYMCSCHSLLFFVTPSFHAHIFMAISTRHFLDFWRALHRLSCAFLVALSNESFTMWCACYMDNRDIISNWSTRLVRCIHSCFAMLISEGSSHTFSCALFTNHSCVLSFHFCICVWMHCRHIQLFLRESFVSSAIFVSRTINESRSAGSSTHRLMLWHEQRTSEPPILYADSPMSNHNS